MMITKPTKPAKLLTPAYPVPQSDEEASASVAQLGVARRALTRKQALMNDQLAATKQKHEESAQPLKQEIEALKQGVHTYCSANRTRLTRAGKVKFARFDAGDISWRLRPPKVTLRGTATLISTFKILGLLRFIRSKEEIDKEAILREPEAVVQIKGISVGSAGEDFVIRPFESELEEIIT